MGSSTIDIPKVGLFRSYSLHGSTTSSGRVFMGADDVSTDPRTEVEATVSGDGEGLTVCAILAGQQPDYAYNAVTANGSLSLTISSADGVSGYYLARARNADGETA